MRGILLLSLTPFPLPTHMYAIWAMFLCSGVARPFPGGWAAQPEAQNEEENEENLRKIEGNYKKYTGKLGNIEEMFLSCPPRSERLATALFLLHL